MKTVDEILLTVEKPARYIGGEFGEKELKPDKLNYCICFPDVYEVAMSNLGIRIVAEAVNSVDGAVADKCYAPWPDFGDELKKEGIPLFSLGMRMPLKNFDIVGFSLQYEMSYTNILYMLDLAGIPFFASDRGEEYPIIQGGGPCAVNPEPLAPFFDLFTIGDGEEVMRQITALKLTTKTKSEFLRKAAEIEGVYVPSLTYPEYDKNGRIIGFSGKKVKKAICLDLDNAVFPETQPVGNIEAVHDRAVIEVMRGCYRGCRFCQAGFIYRPVRPKNVDKQVETACRFINQTGYDSLSINSLSTGDYPYLTEMLEKLKTALPENTTVSLPSLRIDSFVGYYANQAKKNSLTFAPEAGSERLRAVINKDITEEEIMRGVKYAFDLGYGAIKLYFMMGLPTETDEDIEAIGDLVQKIKAVYSADAKKLRNLRVNVSVSTFIPKPFTPFMWESFATREEVEHKIDVLKKRLYIKGVTFNWNDYELSEIEAVLARGGRETHKIILNAYNSGSKFDSWNEFFKKENWYGAIESSGVDIKKIIGKHDFSEVCPWDFLDIGVTKEFFIKEAKLAYDGVNSGGCGKKCNGCGLMASCAAIRAKK